MQLVHRLEPRSSSLFERLGGTEGIETLAEELLQAHLRNPVIRARFGRLAADPDRLTCVQHQLVKFLAAWTGGPAEYAGRSMPEAHRGMNIGDAEYMAFIDDLMLVLRRHGADERTRRDMLSLAYELRAEIVRR